MLSRSELLTTPDKGAATVALHPMNFPWLKVLSGVFERYKFLKLNLEYRPLVGANTSGSSAFGVDWMTSSVSVEKRDGLYRVFSDKASTATKATILALTPSVDTPQWQRVPRVVVPKSLLQSRAWYLTTTPTDATIYDWAPGYLASFFSNKDAGEIWVHYTVHFSGTHS